MSSLKILTVVGARPQFVKAAALSPCLARQGDVEEIIVHTGQHFDRDMSDIFFEELAISEPRFNLGIGGGSHGQNTGRMLEALELVMTEVKPDTVVVYGDTDSTLAAAISAAKLGITLAHVEAGLRSYRRAMPEEINRVLTDRIADVLYAPSAAAKSNLVREGCEPDRVVLCGDVMLDVVKRFQPVAEWRSDILERVSLGPGEYHVLTLHRKENVDDEERLRNIMQGVEASPLPIVFPVHPRTRKRLAEFGVVLPTRVIPIDPLGYLDALKLLANSRMVLTDSGGVQKEAYFLNRPCVTLRDETEWTELVEIGANVLVGADRQRIAAQLQLSRCLSAPAGLYGDGNAAELISSDLLQRAGGT